MPEGASEGVQVFDGPYGLYVKQGKVNASLPEGVTADTITIEQALELLAAKAASGKGSGRKAAGAKAASTTKARSTKSTTGASSTAKASKPAAAKKPPATTKTGRLRASAVRVIKPAGS